MFSIMKIVSFQSETAAVNHAFKSSKTFQSKTSIRACNFNQSFKTVILHTWEHTSKYLNSLGATGDPRHDQLQSGILNQ